MTAPVPVRRGRKPRFNDRRMEVLRVAARTFADQGYSQATLEHIGAELNMTRAALYYYAKSKDELLRACREVAREAVDVAICEAEAQATGLEQIRLYCREHVVLGLDEFGRCFLLMDERDLAPDLREESDNFRRARNRRVEAMLRRGMDDGSFTSGSVVLARRLLFAIMNAVPLWLPSNSEKVASKAADEALDMFIAGLAPRP